MEKILEINNAINNIVWGFPMLFLLLGIGILLSIFLRFIQVLKFKTIMEKTFLKMFHKENLENGEITAFQAVSTALAATIGTGNITGVAIAIATGGPGSVFWMWLSAFFGMATKFSEVVLSITYREKKKDGSYVGGPMYYIKKGIKSNSLAYIFAFFAMFASFGIGNMTQSNSIALVLKSNFNLDVIITAMILSLLSAIVLLGGIKRISKVSERLVPLMALFYILGAVIIIIIHIDRIPNAFYMIFSSAFSKQAAIGGFAGAGFKEIVKQGISRGIFTNEAGLGSAPIAHASAKTSHPVIQGMWGIFEVFMDTIVICSLTSLVILVTGSNYSGLSGSELTSYAFNQGFNGGGYIVAIGLTLFAFSTILGWAFYGQKCSEFIFGEKSVKIYNIFYAIFVSIGAIGGLKAVWGISDTLNGLMAIPNLIAVIMLYKVVIKMTKHYFNNPDKIIHLEEYMKIVEEI